MFAHDTSLSFPTLTQVNNASGRVYRVGGTEYVLPSITRALGAKPKPGLIAWRQRVGAAEAARVSQRATSRGTKLHALAECFLRNQDLPKSDPLTGELWRHICPWIATHVTCVYAQEQPVFSLRLGAAGQLDLLADVDGIFSVVDFKTSEKPKKIEYIDDYFLQGTFYSCATYELTGRAPKQMVFPIVSPTGLQVFVSQPRKHFDELRNRIEFFYETLDKPLALA